MKCGEAQKAENLDHGSTESLDFCKVSDNTNIIVSVSDSQISNHEDHTGFSKGESKWEKFLEINSCDDNGLDDFDGFSVTTERDVFDKASSRGKRKWHYGRSSTCPQAKRSKRTKKEQGNISDTDWLDINSTADKTQHHSQMRFSRNMGIQNPAPHTHKFYDVTSNECNKKYLSTSHSNEMLPSCRNMLSNTQTSLTKCNIYFAKATRDPTPLKMTSVAGGQQGKLSFSTSRWAKFMPSSSVQNQSCDTLAENSPLCSITPDNKYNDNSGCDHVLMLPSQQGNKNRDRKFNSLPLQDLFKVDDDLDEEWWNSL